VRIAGYRIDSILAIPALTGVALLLLLTAWPASAPWPESAWFIHLPPIVFLAAAVAGLCFTQTRVLFLAAVTAATLLLVDRACFAFPDPRRGNTTLLFGSLLLPPLAAVLHRLQERGLWNTHGGTRAVAVIAAGGLAFALTLSPGVQQAIASSTPPSLWTAPGWLRIPGVSLLAFLASLPFLFFRPQGESPRLGLLIALALLFAFAALNHASTLFSPASHRAALVLFGTLSGATLLLAVMETLWRHMNIDELTELPGRRRLKHHLRCLDDAYVLAIVDIDHFKQINDTYGHPAGDQILRYLAAELRRHAEGAAYRYGGEEFVVVYERRAYESALDNLDDLRDAVSRKEFFLRGENRPARKPRHPRRGAPAPSIRLTISVGAARPSAHFKTPGEVLEAADQALYKAKENGRNRVCHVS